MRCCRTAFMSETETAALFDQRGAAAAFNSSQLTEEDPNVIGRNVTLITAGIGNNGDQVEIVAVDGKIV